MKISTVCGPIDAEKLGNTLIHEHIICTSPEFYFSCNNFLPRQKVLDIACAKVRLAAEKYHINTIIDGTPLSLGRDLGLLKEVSELTQVNIIASSGFYFYPSFAQRQLPVDTLAKLMIDEIEHGAIKPAMLKCAVDVEGMTNDVKKMMTVVAQVQRATDLPIFMHSSSHKRNGLEALELFLGNNVPVEKIIVGHTADAGDLSYPLELLAQGCFISVDRIKTENALQRTGILMELIKQGHAERIFIAHDHICCRDSVINDPPADQNEPHGMDVIHTLVLLELEKAFPGENISSILLNKNVLKLYKG